MNSRKTISFTSPTRPPIAPSRALPPGVLVADTYRVERRLGEGRVGTVVQARHVLLDRLVALKFLRVQPEASDGSAWFLREAQAAARIQSEFVVRVSDSGHFDGSPYLVMDFLEGQTLAALLEARPRLPVPLVIGYALQAAEGLAHAHALGIVHRDLKPSNLFLVRRPKGSMRLKVLDFGISKSVYGPGDSIEATGGGNPLFGSPRFMAPEQIRSSSDVDRRTDLWALGAVVYEMLAGRSPFEGETPSEICERVLKDEATPLREHRPDVPPTLEAAVMQCLEKDPDRRFRTVGALARALAASGAPAARKTADRIAGIAPRAERHDAAGERRKDDDVSAVVPHASLTQTGYGRAVADIERIVHGEFEEVAATPPSARLRGALHPLHPGRPPSTVVMAARPHDYPLASTAPPRVFVLHPTETPASFSTLPTPSRLRRLPVMPAVVACAALAVGVVILFASHHVETAQTSSSVAPPPPSPEPTPSASASTSTSAGPLAVPAPGEPTGVAPGPVVAPVPSPAPAGPARRPAPAPPPSPLQVNTRPQRATAATPNAAPVGTVGFGGRE